MFSCVPYQMPFKKAEKRTQRTLLLPLGFFGGAGAAGSSAGTWQLSDQADSSCASPQASGKRQTV